MNSINKFKMSHLGMYRNIVSMIIDGKSSVINTEELISSIQKQEDRFIVKYLIESLESVNLDGNVVGRLIGIVPLDDLVLLTNIAIGVYIGIIPKTKYNKYCNRNINLIIDCNTFVRNVLRESGYCIKTITLLNYQKAFLSFKICPVIYLLVSQSEKNKVNLEFQPSIELYQFIDNSELEVAFSYL